MKQYKKIPAIGGILLMTAAAVFGAAPVPALVDTEPGINVPFTGDPNDPDTWDYNAQDWGIRTFRQGDFKMVESPFSDVGYFCGGNEGFTGEANPCANATLRYQTTYKGVPDPIVSMSESKD